MDFFADISEYVGLFEEVQGNLTMGLVWEHVIEESMGLEQELYLVWTEQINDEFDLDVGFDPFHILFLDETIDVYEIMGGVPIEVQHSNINVVHAREAAPVKIWWFGANVVHGPDVFFEEVISNVHCRSTYANGVPYYFREVYESIDFEFHNIQPHPGVTKTVKLSTGDLVNMRHSVDQQYYFNNLSADRLFVYDNGLWGWKHDIDDQFQVGDYAIRQLVFSLIDHLFPGDMASGQWKGGVSANERLFAWDKGQIAHRWPDVIAEGIGVTDAAIAPIFASLLDELGIASDLDLTTGKIQLSVDDQMRVQSAALVLETMMAKVLDGFTVVDHSTAVLIKKYLENILDGIELSSETMAGMIFLDIIEEGLSGADTSKAKAIMEITAADETDFEGSIN